MVTINQLLNNLEQFATNHGEINSFGKGELYDLATSGTTRYPLLWVDVANNGIQGDLIQYNLDCYVVDRLQKGNNNWGLVYSALQNVGADVVSFFLDPSYFPHIRVQQSVTFEPVRYEFRDDELAGWKFTLTFEQFFDQNRCAIPQSGAYTFPPDQSYVSIINADTNEVITTVPCGGSYEVLQVSVINGGNASTTYTNQIIQA